MEEQRGELLVQFEQERRRWEEEKTKIEDEQKRLREMWAQAQTSLQQKTNEFSVLVDRELETSMLKVTCAACALSPERLAVKNNSLLLRSVWLAWLRGGWKQQCQNRFLCFIYHFE